MLKVTIRNEDVTATNTYTPNSTATTFAKAEAIGERRKIRNTLIITGFNILSIRAKQIMQTKNKDTEDLKKKKKKQHSRKPKGPYVLTLNFTP